ncbi:alpha/beta fold hydrolase [Micromonospora psammae]|uniref:alpha/beta fold hydrolase n=1 Tax=Micromonospora sp. CPCC 205556 TaxID=3122398 RepID=UPI002FF413A2
MREEPAVVLVHGAFADSTAWNPVLAGLTRQDVDVIAVANPLRSLQGDAEYLRDVIEGIDRPVILVGHSYGGMVITEAATDLDAVRGLVYVAAFTPDQGESAFELAGKFAGSTLGSTPLAYPVGGNEVRIGPAKSHVQFAADPEFEDASRPGRTQRPVTEKALTDCLSTAKPAWRTQPTWQVFGDVDRNIPVELFRFQVRRSAPYGVYEVPGASHAVATSQPEAVTATILQAIAYATAY